MKTKNKSLFLLCSFLLCSIVVCAQSISGTIKNSFDSTVVEFASVYIKNTKKGVLANMQGEFILDCENTTSNDSIVISQLGYDTKYFKLGDFLETDIYLEPRLVDLESITVKSSSRKLRKRKIGGWKKRTNASFAANIVEGNYSLAQFVPTMNYENGYIESISVYLVGFYKNKGPVKLDIRRLDENCNCPGESLLSQSVFLDESVKGWNKIDVSSQYIDLPNKGYFITYDRVFDNQNYEGYHSIGFIERKSETNYPTYIKYNENGWRKSPLFYYNSGRVPLFRSIIRTNNIDY